MSKIVIYLILIVTLLLIGGIVVLNKGFKNTQVVEVTNYPQAELNKTSSPAKLFEVVYQGRDFSPDLIEISVGSVVNFINKTQDPLRVSSDPHPIHTDLLGFDSNILNNNQIYSFSFTKPGTFGYHNHLRPNIKGKIIVR